MGKSGFNQQPLCFVDRHTDIHADSAILFCCMFRFNHRDWPREAESRIPRLQHSFTGKDHRSFHNIAQFA